MTIPSRDPASSSTRVRAWLATHAVELLAIVLLLAALRFALGVATHQAELAKGPNTQHESAL